MSQSDDRPAGPVTILLVEDNAAHAELLVRSLEDHAQEKLIHRVSDGEQALDYLFRRGRFANPETSPRPSVILLDLRLPRVGGLEVLEEIKRAEHLKDIPVVVITTSNAEGDVAAADRLGADRYLVKPVGSSEVDELMTGLGPRTAAAWANW